MLLVDKKPTYINGVDGTNRLDMAEANGANAFRTWGGSVESIQRDIEKAEQNHMLIMQGIGMTRINQNALNTLTELVHCFYN